MPLRRRALSRPADGWVTDRAALYLLLLPDARRRRRLGQPGGLTLHAGLDALRQYEFNTGAAKHWFCGICGIYTHHQRRSNPSQYGVNAACLAGISPFDFDEVPVLDGVNHPSDSPEGKPRQAGILRFFPA